MNFAPYFDMLFFGTRLLAGRLTGHCWWRQGAADGNTSDRNTVVDYHYAEGVLGPMLARNIDCQFAPPLPKQALGRANLVYMRGFQHAENPLTILAFWDRSLDSRRNSNGAFVASGLFTFEEMLAEAKRTFPDVVARLPSLKRWDWGACGDQE